MIHFFFSFWENFQHLLMFCHIFLDPCVRQTSQCFTPYTSSKGGYIPTQQGLNLSTGDSWGPIFLCHGGILSTIGCLAQFLLLSTRCQWHPLLFVTTKNVFRHCQVSPGGRITPGWELPHLAKIPSCWTPLVVILTVSPGYLFVSNSPYSCVHCYCSKWV